MFLPFLLFLSFFAYAETSDENLVKQLEEYNKENLEKYSYPHAPFYTDKPVYTWTDEIQIRITALAWNTNPFLIDSIGGSSTHPFKIGSSENYLKPYKLVETSANSGIFTGTVTLTGFEHDANGDNKIDTNPRTRGTGPNDGLLEVRQDSPITMSFQATKDLVIIDSVLVSWNIGRIEFAQNMDGTDHAVIGVLDADMNLNPKALDQVIVTVYSESDLGGLEITLSETRQDSGIFIGKVFLSSLSSHGNRLYATLGETIFATYTDYTLPAPYSKSDSLMIRTAFDSVENKSDKKLVHSPIKFTDEFGTSVQSFSANQPINIVGNILNNQNIDQVFIYIIQIKNSDGVVESILWASTKLSANQNLDVSKFWIPTNSGMFFIETFLWESIQTMPLDNFLSTVITVS